MQISHKLYLFIPAKRIADFLQLFCIALLITFIGCDNGNNLKNEKKLEQLLQKVENLPTDAPNYLTLLDSLRTSSIKNNFAKGVAKSFSLRAAYLSSQKKYEASLSEYHAAVQANRQIKNYAQLAKDFNKIGGIHFRLKNKDEAIAAFKHAIEFSNAGNDSTQLGSAYNNIGFIFWQVSNYDSAVFYFEKALQIRKKLSDKEFLSTTYNNLGTIFFNWSLYDKALDYYLHALEMQKQIGNNNGMALSLCNIGLVYTSTAQNEKALEYYYESLPHAELSGELQTVGYVYSCLGSAFSETNKDSSLIYFNKSYDTFLKAKDVDGQILALQGIGKYYLDLHDLTTAKRYFTDMLQLANNEKISMRIAEAYKYLGEITLLENDLSVSQKYFEKSIEISEKINLKLILRDSYLSLSEIYERTGNISSAFTALQKHNKYQLEIENEGMRKRLMDLKNKSQYESYNLKLRTQVYENEKQKIYLVITVTALLFLVFIAVILFRLNSKRRKINLLLSEKNMLIENHNTEIKEKNEKLLEINEAKEKLFSIVAHDLRSPFNALINFAEILKEEYDVLSDAERKEYIATFGDTATKTYELVENLLNLSASRTGKINFNPEMIELNKLTDKIFQLSVAQANKKGVKLINSVEPFTAVFADKPMLEVVIRNLINNAIKYCNAGGKIEVSTFIEANQQLISIKDSGIGMSDELKKNIFNINAIRSKRGTDGEKGTGLGLGLCKEFIEKHGGTISVESTLHVGSTFIFSLPRQ